MYGTILLPTDGSEATEPAVERALDLAETYDAALHVVYVVDTAALPADVGAGTVLTNMEDAGERIVERVRERAEASGLTDVTASVVHGTPHRAILEYADEAGVDLVVMGTHGRTGLDRYLLGSVTEKVVRLSEVPVLTVRMPDEER